ncbi:MAG: type III-B CRISPR-associated protein Cas10/Cmr2, partial [Armatimonadota bacterium]|nr:type III-B CRISPR-associated protein Cas10/Cmr2 [Armatimonadota bacterium]
MTTYLFSISIGPVQEFIAAARRTADLRAGSQLLQHLAKHVAQEVEKAGGKLIFPANTNVPGPNKVLAEIATDQPSEIAERLRESAVQWLHEEWQQVHARLKSAGVAVIDDLAQGQISHFLEFYAAWVPLEGDYTAARERVEALLAGRKALRDFSQPASVHGIPKSPLDPSRDCALLLNRKGSSYSVPESAQRLPSLRLKKTEFLDAVSLLKRAQDARDVPSTSLMAAQSILPLAEKRVPEAVQTLRTVAQSSQGAVDVGDLMFPSRLQEEMSEVPALQEQKERVERARRDILTSVGLSECPAYYAILAADGDRMGKLISAQNTVDEHRQLSEAVAEVAKRMTEAIRQHDGYCVYAGGDDVLALLPVNQALECAT